MEMVRQRSETRCISIQPRWPPSDDRHKPISTVRSVFPDDAVACIYGPSRLVTSSKARTKGWRLVFEWRSAPFIEPLIGYTGGDDTLTQVALSFPTLQSATRYAERQGLTYVVRTPSAQTGNGRSRRLEQKPAQAGRSTHAFSDATLDRLGLGSLQESYGRALDGAANEPSDPRSRTSPLSVVRDPTLTLEAKRSILMNWAWTEHLIDQATNEGIAENNRPSRLDEVEQALLALERVTAADHHDPGTRKAA